MPELTDQELAEFQAFKTQAEAAQAAQAGLETKLAALEATNRTNAVKSVLSDLKAPAQIADLYPADGEITPDAVKTFLRDKVGLNPDIASQWSSYEQGRLASEGAPEQVDGIDAILSKEHAANEKFYRNPYQVTVKEEQEMRDFSAQASGLLKKWDREVEAGKLDILVQAQGFGGRIDPPPYARRAVYGFAPA